VVIVPVAVAVIDPVIVAALGNGNDTVDLIDAVNAECEASFPRATRSWRINFVGPPNQSRRTLPRVHLDVMRSDELIDADHYARGTELLERIVAMLTKLIDP
jgi:hypothetical protein